MDYGNTLDWLISTSLIATILIGIIYIVRAAIRKKVSPSIIYYMWFLVIIKLIIPYGPESSFSIYNLFDDNKEIIGQGTATNYNTIENIINNNTAISNDIIEDTTNFTSEEQIKEETLITNPTKEKDNLKEVACYFWVIGVALITLYIIGSYINLIKTSKHRDNEDIEKVNNVLVVCLKTLSIKRKVIVVITNKVNTPSLCGILNPRILLPENLINEVSDEELKYILMHELCHLKRGDILVAWIISIIKALYWFNPAVYFALRTMQNDCEVSCDNMVLSYLDIKENLSYGNTIINVLSYMGKTRFLPGITSMVASKKTLKDRIRRISKNKKFTPRNILLGLVVILIVGIIGLTSSKAASQVDEIKKTWSQYIKGINNDDESQLIELKTDDFDTLQFNEGFEEYLKSLENLNHVDMDTIEFQSESSAVVNLTYSYTKGGFTQTSSYEGVLMVREDEIWKIANIAWKVTGSSDSKDSLDEVEGITEDNFFKYFRDEGYNIVVNSGAGGGIKLPSTFDEVKNNVNVGEIIRGGLEFSKAEGLDFSEYLGERVMIKSLDVEVDGYRNTFIGLFEQGNMIGFWSEKSHDEEGRHIMSKIMSSLQNIDESSKSEYDLSKLNIEDLKLNGDVVSIKGEEVNIEGLEKFIDSFKNGVRAAVTVVVIEEDGLITTYSFKNVSNEFIEVVVHYSKENKIEEYSTKDLILRKENDDTSRYTYNLLLDDGTELKF